MGLDIDKHICAGLFLMLQKTMNYKWWSEDCDILAAVHKFGPGFADD